MGDVLMKKAVAILIIAIALVFGNLLVSFADSSEKELYGNLLSEEEKTVVRSALDKAEEETGYDVYVYVSDSIIGASDALLRIFGIGEYDDAVILHIVKYSDSYYEYMLYTYGSAAKLSDSSVDRILDETDVYRNIKSGNLAEGIVAFAEVLAEEKASSDRSALITVIIISSVIALCSGGATIGIIIYKYKKKLKSPVYPLSKYANMDLEHSSDNFLGSAVTRTRVGGSSDGSRGGSGGGGGGFRGKR